PAPADDTAPEIVHLDPYTVQSTRDITAAAIAIHEQRYAPGIKSVMSTDAFGDIADGNVADFVKFLPGVTVDGDTLSIGGIPSHAVPITMDGFAIASAADQLESREVSLTQVSISNMSRLEVTRSQTPDTPADAIGGAINLVPRSAADHRRPHWNLRLHASFRDKALELQNNAYDFRPNATLNAILPLTPKFGLSLNLSTHETDGGTRGLRTDWVPHYKSVDRTAARPLGYKYPAPNNGIDSWLHPYPILLEYHNQPKKSTRRSLGLTADLRLTPRDEISLGLQYSTQKTTPSGNDRLTLNLVTLEGDSTLATPDSVQSAPGKATVTLTHDYAVTDGATLMPTLRWQHKGPLWHLTLAAAWSRSTSRTRDTGPGAFQSASSRISNATIRLEDYGYYGPAKITVTKDGQPLDPFDLASYSLMQTASNHRKSQDEKRTLKASARRTLKLPGQPLALKLGLDHASTTRTHSRAYTHYNYRGPDGKALTADDNALQWADYSYLRRGPDYAPAPRAGINPDALRATFQENPSYFEYTEQARAADHRTHVAATKRVTETITAPYLRLDLPRLLGTRLHLTGGWRYEHAQTSGTGPLVDPTLNYQRDPAGNVITGSDGKPALIHPYRSLEWARATNILLGARATRAYAGWFPSLNLKYDLTPNLVARLSYSRSIARPNYNYILPGVDVPDPDADPANHTITMRNPDLRPWTADCYGATLEYYFRAPSEGVLSARVLLRDIDNFWRSLTGPVTDEFFDATGLDPELYADYNVKTTYNLSSPVRIISYEFEYSQKLGFLPRWARGLSLFANATIRQAIGNSAGNITGYMRTSINYGLALNRPRLTLRANANMRGRESRGEEHTGRFVEPGTYEYYHAAANIDASLEYRFTRRVALQCTVKNLLNQLRATERHGPSTPAYARLRTLADSRPQFTLGLKTTF
ncbi:MAG: TonB-dependent receptor, partial [Opitutaceae bacterium]|nr:TonB-dependent receptor [Opitutaceae bacterium]